MVKRYLGIFLGVLYLGFSIYFILMDTYEPKIAWITGAFIVTLPGSIISFPVGLFLVHSSGMMSGIHFIYFCSALFNASVIKKVADAFTGKSGSVAV